MRVNTSIYPVPKGLDPEMYRFLSSVRDALSIREGMSRDKQKRFAEMREVHQIVDDELDQIKKILRNLPAQVKHEDKPIDFSDIENRLKALKRELESLKTWDILSVELKDGVFINTFLHVGPDIPSDQGWNPEGVGIHKYGIYGISGSPNKAKFFLGAGDFTLPPNDPLYDILGSKITAGELRFGDDVRYTEVEVVSGGVTTLIPQLAGEEWLWYNSLHNLLHLQITHGSLTVGSYLTGTGFAVNDRGLQLLHNGELKFAVTLKDIDEAAFYEDLEEDPPGWPGGIVPGGTGFFAGDIIGSRIYGVDGLLIQPNIFEENTPYIRINNKGLIGYSWESTDHTINFCFALDDIYIPAIGKTIEAGEAFFKGTIYASDIAGVDGITIRGDSSGRYIQINESGLMGYNNDAPVFGFTLRDWSTSGATPDLIDAPAGSGIFTGYIGAARIISSEGIFAQDDNGIIIFSTQGIHAVNTIGNPYTTFAVANQAITVFDGPNLSPGHAYFRGRIRASEIEASSFKFERPVGDTGKQRSLIMDDTGLWGIGETGKTSFVLTFNSFFHEDTGYNFPAGTALFSGNIIASEIVGIDGLRIRPDYSAISQNTYILLNEVGLAGVYNGDLRFAFNLKAASGLPAGSAWFKGQIWAGSKLVGSPEVTMYDLVCQETEGQLKKVNQTLITADNIEEGQVQHFSAEIGAVRKFSSLEDDGGTFDMTNSKHKILGADGIEVEPGGNIIINGSDTTGAGSIQFNYDDAESVKEAAIIWDYNPEYDLPGMYINSKVDDVGLYFDGWEIIEMGARGEGNPQIQLWSQYDDPIHPGDSNYSKMGIYNNIMPKVYWAFFKTVDEAITDAAECHLGLQNELLYFYPVPFGSVESSLGDLMYRWDYLYLEKNASIGGNCDIIGALSKGSGSFLIDHPLAPTEKTLRYGFTESPRYDLIHRGTVQLKNGKAKIDIDAFYGLTPGTFAALCQDAQVMSVQAVDSFVKVKAGQVVDGTFEIEAETKDFEGMVNWIVIAERKDPHVMHSEFTDENGHLINEAEKPEPDMTLLADEERPAEPEHDPGPKHEKIYVEKEQVVEEWDEEKNAYVRRKKMVKVPEYEFVDVLDEAGKVIGKRRIHKTIEKPTKPRPKPRPTEQKKPVNMGEYRGFYREPEAYRQNHPEKTITFKENIKTKSEGYR